MEYIIRARLHITTAAAAWPESFLKIFSHTSETGLYSYLEKPIKQEKQLKKNDTSKLAIPT